MRAMTVDRRAPTTYAIGAWLFLRALGVVYLAAFGSLALQVPGLIGSSGLAPAQEFLDAAREIAVAQQLGAWRFWEWPTVFWVNASDGVLRAVCIAGVILAVPVVLGVGAAVALPVLWVLYLSLATVAGEFLLFQWDALLLEAGLLAVMVAPLSLVHRATQRPHDGARLLLWLLLFKLMLASGIVKLASGDPSWWSLTALSVHYETQPLPTPLGWYAHHLPDVVHRMSTFAVLAIELMLPWCIWTTRSLRHVAATAFVALQALIALTGNFAFFNLLTAALCLLLIDDVAWARVLPAAGGGREGEAWPAPRAWPTLLVAAAATVIVPISASILIGQAGIGWPRVALLDRMFRIVAPLRSVNAYGLFAVMTTSRSEIVIEGTIDGTTWLPYEFRDKPGAVSRRPRWVAPHQPRLDWQMWFAALGRVEENPWVARLCERLLEGSPEVLALLASNPFPVEPPTRVRALRYDYRMATLADRRAHGVWWTREHRGEYLPSLGRPP